MVDISENRLLICFLLAGCTLDSSCTSFQTEKSSDQSIWISFSLTTWPWFICFVYSQCRYEGMSPVVVVTSFSLNVLYQTPTRHLKQLWSKIIGNDNNGQYIWVIDQTWGQDGWILAKFFFCMFMYQDEVEVHKHAKKERGQHPAIMTEQAWSMKDLLLGIKRQNMINFPCGTKPVSVANYSARFGSSCPLAELVT